MLLYKDLPATLKSITKNERDGKAWQHKHSGSNIFPFIKLSVDTVAREHSQLYNTAKWGLLKFGISVVRKFFKCKVNLWHRNLSGFILECQMEVVNLPMWIIYCEASGDSWACVLQMHVVHVCVFFCVIGSMPCECLSRNSPRGSRSGGACCRCCLCRRKHQYGARGSIKQKWFVHITSTVIDKYTGSGLRPRGGGRMW